MQKKYSPAKIKRKQSLRYLSGTASLSLSLYRKGKTITQIARQRELSEGTINTHLQQAYLSGEYFDIDSVVTPSKQKTIEAVFKRLGMERLAPVKKFLGDDYSYIELRWVQAKMARR